MCGDKPFLPQASPVGLLRVRRSTGTGQAPCPWEEGILMDSRGEGYPRGRDTENQGAEGLDRAVYSFFARILHTGHKISSWIGAWT